MRSSILCPTPRPTLLASRSAGTCTHRLERQRLLPDRHDNAATYRTRAVTTPPAAAASVLPLAAAASAATAAAAPRRSARSSSTFSDGTYILLLSCMIWKGTLGLAAHMSQLVSCHWSSSLQSKFEYSCDKAAGSPFCCPAIRACVPFTETGVTAMLPTLQCVQGYGPKVTHLDDLLGWPERLNAETLAVDGCPLQAYRWEVPVCRTVSGCCQ